LVVEIRGRRPVTVDVEIPTRATLELDLTAGSKQ